MRIGLYLAKLDETPPATSPLFTEPERRYCLSRRNPDPHLAGRYAAKRATCLALDLASEEILGDIDVARQPGRAPTLNFRGKAKRATQPGIKSHLSLSHSGNYAVALVVVE